MNQDINNIKELLFTTEVTNIELAYKLCTANNLNFLNVVKDLFNIDIADNLARLMNQTSYIVIGDTLPPFVMGVSSVKNIEWINEKLQNIPEDLTKVKNLTHLVMSGNNIKELPEYFDKFKNLIFLDLADNQLSKISPETVEKLNGINRNITVIIDNNPLEYEDPDYLVKLKHQTPNVKWTTYNELRPDRAKYLFNKPTKLK